jgi:hypothetical protein
MLEFFLFYRKLFSMYFSSLQLPSVYAVAFFGLRSNLTTGNDVTLSNGMKLYLLPTRHIS